MDIQNVKEFYVQLSSPAPVISCQDKAHTHMKYDSNNQSKVQISRETTAPINMQSKSQESKEPPGTVMSSQPTSRAISQPTSQASSQPTSQASSQQKVQTSTQSKIQTNTQPTGQASAQSKVQTSTQPKAETSTQPKAETSTQSSTKDSDTPVALSRFHQNIHPCQKILGGSSLVKYSGETGMVKVVADSCGTDGLLGIYGSASWCGPCRMFTPLLVALYEQLKKRQKKLEVIFVSCDYSIETFNNYFKDMPWFALPFADERRLEKVRTFFNISGIPVLILLEPSTGKVLVKNAVPIVRSDPKGELFHMWKDFPQERLGKPKVPQSDKDRKSEESSKEKTSTSAQQSTTAQHAATTQTDAKPKQVTTAQIDPNAQQDTTSQQGTTTSVVSNASKAQKESKVSNEPSTKEQSVPRSQNSVTKVR